MRRYETIVILRPSLGEADNQAVIDRAIGTIEDFDGSVIKTDKWGLKKLAYPIKKEAQGYYVYIQYAGLPAGVDEMERVFRIDDNVMKYMTVKLQDVFTPLPEDEAVETEEAAAEPAAEASATATETATAAPAEEAKAEEVKAESKDTEASATATETATAAPSEEAKAEEAKAESKDTEE
jgi:small subunit ribosomal protein S6